MKLTTKQIVGDIINNTLEEFGILDLFYEDEVLAYIRENYTPDQIYNKNILEECIQKLEK